MWAINSLKEQYEVRTKSYDSYIQVNFREIKSSNSQTPLLDILLLVRLDRAEYSIECFELKNDSNKKLHGIKVEGPWNCETLEKDLLKIARREFSTFKRQYYPF